MGNHSDFDKYDEPRLHMERLLKAKLVEFDLSMRILCPLDAAGVKTLGDLVKHSRKSLLQINQLGVLSAARLESFLDGLGLELAK